MPKTPNDVLKFWFEDHNYEDWFGGKAEFDAEVRDQFEETLHQAERCELFTWRATPKGRVAEVIVLDQFTRQLYRKDALAFASDPLALALAQEAVAQGLDQQLNNDEKQFLYMPYMHSESLAIHDEAVKLFKPLGEDALKYEIAHREVIERFGRYPKRNEALGRLSTSEEIAYMNDRSDSMF